MTMVNGFTNIVNGQTNATQANSTNTTNLVNIQDIQLEKMNVPIVRFKSITVQS